MPEDQSNGFFVACFIRDEDSVVAPAATETEETAIEGEEAELTHAQRQEAFRAKSKARGGKGGPKGLVPSKLVALAEKAAPPKPKVEVKEVASKTKKSVPGKKAAYLAEKKRRSEEKEQGGKKAKTE